MLKLARRWKMGSFELYKLIFHTKLLNLTSEKGTHGFPDEATERGSSTPALTVPLADQLLQNEYLFWDPSCRRSLTCCKELPANESHHQGGEQFKAHHLRKVPPQASPQIAARSTV